jgi:hypothetical protein
MFFLASLVRISNGNASGAALNNAELVSKTRSAVLNNKAAGNENLRRLNSNSRCFIFSFFLSRQRLLKILCCTAMLFQKALPFLRHTK